MDEPTRPRTTSRVTGVFVKVIIVKEKRERGSQGDMYGMSGVLYELMPGWSSRGAGCSSALAASAVAR